MCHTSTLILICSEGIEFFTPVNKYLTYTLWNVTVTIQKQLLCGTHLGKCARLNQNRPWVDSSATCLPETGETCLLCYKVLA